MKKETRKKILEEIIMTAISVGVAFLPPPAGLGRSAMLFLGIFLWVVMNWAIPVMPAFTAGLIMLIAAVLLGIVPFKTAFASFGGSTVWLLFGALLLGAAVKKTGLLSRLSLAILNIFPPSFRGQAAGLILSGVLIGPFMPSTTAKVSIMGGFSTKIAELLGFKPKSRGMNGIFLAMYAGFTLLAPIFISSSFFSYLILGMIPPEDAAYFNFLSWLRAMLPWGIFTLIFSFIAIILMYRPKEEKKLSREDIQQLKEKLGPMSRDEKSDP